MAAGLPVHGDFPGLGEDDLEIAEVVQKTVLAVDETGTEAATATGVVVEPVTGRDPQQEVVTFDRPFLFLVTDVQTRSPLVMAVVTDPNR